MADTVDASQRSRMMAGIRTKDTAPELRVRSYLHRAGFRFQLHRRDLPGKPDIVLPRYRSIVFVHGCFWHRHAGCPLAATPSTNKEFWQEKFRANVGRDARNQADLEQLGWHVLTIWSCMTNADVLNALVCSLREREWASHA